MLKLNLAEQRQLRLATIEKYLASGLAQEKFCQQEKLAYSTFQVWLKKYRQAQKAMTPLQHSDNRFVPLTFTAESATPVSAHYVIEYPNGVVLRIHGAIEAETLLQLLNQAGR